MVSSAQGSNGNELCSVHISGPNLCTYRRTTTSETTLRITHMSRVQTVVTGRRQRNVHAGIHLTFVLITQSLLLIRPALLFFANFSSSAALYKREPGAQCLDTDRRQRADVVVSAPRLLQSDTRHTGENNMS